MEFGQKKNCEIDLFDFMSFFWPGVFEIFWPTVKYVVVSIIFNISQDF